MGILNVTPDSFSDGGCLALTPGSSAAFDVDIDAAVRKGLSLIADGADILDVGGESTRPGSSPVDAEEQIRRVVPVIEHLVRLTDVPISIDTCSAETADRALAAGASIVNDISGGTFEPAILDAVRSRRAGFCLGHIQGTPADMQKAPRYEDAPREVADFLRKKRESLLDLGIEPNQIVIDPGLGFGKTPAHNLAILARLDLLRAVGAPILIGHSRKRFLAEAAAEYHFPPPPKTLAEPRDYWTAELTKRLVPEGIAVFRVHNAALNRAVLKRR